MKKVVAIIQARMGSTRLPGKVMTEIAGKPMLYHVINRVKHAKELDYIVIATTNLKEDSQILDFASEMEVRSYAGSENDVLDRYYQAAIMSKADVIVRITADCPLADPNVIDKVVRYYLNNDLDYVGTSIKPTYPDGIDVEVFSFASLKKAWDEAKLASEREHVTPYIWKNPSIFRIGNIENDEDISYMRWSVDEQCDLEFLREIYNRLYAKDTLFYMEDVLDLLMKNPELMNINKGIVRNEGYLKSIKEDEEGMNSYLDICDKLIENKKPFKINFDPYFPNNNERCIETPWVVSHCHNKEKILEVGISLVDQTYLNGILKLLNHDVKEFHTLDIVPVERTLSRFTTDVQNIILERFTNTIGDARNIPYPNEFFDQIFCISTIEHIGHDEYECDRAKNTVFKRGSKEPLNRNDILKNFTADIEAIQEFQRILKQSGELLLSVPMGKGGLCTIRDSMGLIAIQTEYDVERWNMLILQSGLKLVEERFFKHSNEKGWFEVDNGIKLKDVTCDNLPMAKGVALAKLIKI